MTFTSPREGLHTGIRTRGPGYSAIRDCLREQSVAPERSSWARHLGRDPLAPRAEHAYETALGQLSVARQLGGLGPDWTVLHSIPLDEDGDVDLDHLVIGPPGVFLLTTRRYPGARITLAGNSFRVDGHSGVSLPGVQAIARRTSQLLSEAADRYIPVTAVVVVVGAASLSTGRLTPVLPVLPAERVRPWLLGHPRAVADSVVDELVALADDPDTWRVDRELLHEAPRQSQRFQRLQRDVAAAATRRRRLAAGAVVLGSLVIAGLAVETVALLTPVVAGG